MTHYDLSQAFAEAREVIREQAEYLKRIKYSLADAHPLDRCGKSECPICGIIACPFGCNEHDWKDGCPCCYGSEVEPA